MKIPPVVAPLAFVAVVFSILGILLGRTPTPTPARMNSVIFGKAVTVCANLGGLTYVRAIEVRERAGFVEIHAFFNLGAALIVQLPYVGKTDAPTKLTST